jgi:hypothetical protein
MPVEIRRVGAGDERRFDRVADEAFDASVDADRLAAYLADPGHLIAGMRRQGHGRGCWPLAASRAFMRS